VHSTKWRRQRVFLLSKRLRSLKDYSPEEPIELYISLVPYFVDDKQQTTELLATMDAYKKVIMK